MLLPLLALSEPSFVPPLSQAVVYEANLRAEGASGGFAAFTRRLDSIKALGVNVVWLMPVQPVGKLRSAGGLGSPYAVADYEAVNPEFGTPEELKRLVAEAHRRKIAVILDWVANHTAWDNPWVKSHPDWYTHDAKGEITIPAGTNWRDVADLNYDNPELRSAMIASMRGWIGRYGLDGFRFDTADWLPADFWKEAVTNLRASAPKPILLLAEGFRKEHATSGFDLEYGWPFFDRLVAIFKGDKASSVVRAWTQEAKNGLPHLRFVTNHDKNAWEGTPTEFFKSPAGVRAATVVAALYEGGVPLVYSGQEVAWPKRIPIFDRSAVEWSGGSSERKWLSSIFRLRRSHAALQSGDLVDSSTDDAVVFLRRKGRDQALVMANVRDREASAPVADASRGIWRDAETNKRVHLDGSLVLPAFGYRIFVRRAD